MEDWYNAIIGLQKQFNEAISKRFGMDWEKNEHGYTVEKLYEIAGKEDRVVDLSFREGSPSEQMWGNSVTCVLLYTERERIKLMESIESGGGNYGKVKAKYLLFDLNKEQIEKLKEEGFNSQDVVEILVAPLLQDDNVYKGEKLRKLNQIKIPIDPEPPLEEMRFELGVLCKFMEHGMLLSPSEHVNYLALKLVLGAKLDEKECEIVFDKDGKIHNNDVSRRYLYYKSRLGVLSEEKKRQQALLESMRTMERLTFLDDKLKEMGTSLEKLKNENLAICVNIVLKALRFNEKRLNPTGHYPIYLTYEGYIHIGLRHIKEWQFGDYYKDRDKFQLNEEDVIPTLRHIVEEINDDYQSKKAERPDFKYRRFGKNSYYFSGDYYMFHIDADGRIANFSKIVDRVGK